MGAILDELGQPELDENGDPILDDLPDTSVPPTATFPASDFSYRMRTVLPARWFPDPANSPTLQALLEGFEANWSDLYSATLFAGSVGRIATAPGGFLDMAALDYLGGLLTRKPGQPDPAFSSRVRAEIIRPRVTRYSIRRVLTDLTDTAPIVFEPARATDTGGLGWLGMTVGTGLAYADADGIGGAGGWGSLALPFQSFVTAYRATGGGIANVGGYYTGSGWAGGGYGVGALEWASLDMSLGQITDADIYAAVASVIPASGIAWVTILDTPITLASPTLPPGRLKDDATELLADDTGGHLLADPEGSAITDDAARTLDDGFGGHLLAG